MASESPLCPGLKIASLFPAYVGALLRPFFFLVHLGGADATAVLLEFCSLATLISFPASAQPRHLRLCFWDHCFLLNDPDGNSSKHAQHSLRGSESDVADVVISNRFWEGTKPLAGRSLCDKSLRTTLELPEGLKDGHGQSLQINKVECRLSCHAGCRLWVDPRCRCRWKGRNGCECGIAVSDLMSTFKKIAIFKRF